MKDFDLKHFSRILNYPLNNLWAVQNYRPLSVCLKLSQFLLLAFFLSYCSFQEPQKNLNFSIIHSDAYLVESGNYDLILDEKGIEMRTADVEEAHKLSFTPGNEIKPLQKGESVLYEDLFDNTDMLIYDQGSGLAAYDLVLRPGANPEDIAFQLENAESVFINPKGELVFPLEGDEVRHSAPIAFQKIENETRFVNCNFKLDGDQLGFELGEFDPDRELIIDPTIYLASEVGTVELRISQTVSPANPTTGTPITYTLSYGARSTTDNPINAKIILPLPLAEGIQATPFANSGEIASSQILPDGSLEIILGPNFKSGSARAILVEVIIPPNSLCDGTVFSSTATIDADNSDAPNPVSAPEPSVITISDTPPSWSIDVTNNSLPVPGVLGSPNQQNGSYTIQLDPISSGVNSLSNVQVRLTLPNQQGISFPNICNGCVKSGNQLIWNLPTYFSGNPLTFELAFDNTYSSSSYPVKAQFKAQYGPKNNLCPDQISNSVNKTFDFTTQPAVECVDSGGGSNNRPWLTEYTVGKAGQLKVKFQNTGNIPLTNLTALINIPSEVEVTDIPAINFPSSFAGIDYEIAYTTFDGNSGRLPTASGTNYKTTTGSPATSILSPGNGDGLKTVSLRFLDETPPQFMPNVISFDYQVLSNDLESGDPLIGANPRIADEENCVACLNDQTNPAIYTCISASVELSANSAAGSVSDNCISSKVARSPISGPVEFEKTVAGDKSYFPGQTARFTLKFKNCGTESLTNVSISDQLPEGFAFDDIVSASGNLPAQVNNPTVSGDPAQGGGGQTVSWTLGSLPGASDPCEAFEIVYEATVLANAQPAAGLKNCFELSGELGGAPIESCNTAQELGDCVVGLSIPPVGPTALRKLVDKNIKFPGEEVVYDLRWKNQGPFIITSMRIEDILPDDLEFLAVVSYSDNLYANGDGTGALLGTLAQDGGNPQKLSGTFSNLPGGDPFSEEFVIRIRAKVRIATPPSTVPDQLPKSVQNCFTIDQVTGNTITHTYPKSACVDLEVRPPGPISFSKSVIGSTTRNPKQEFQYRIRWRHAGPYALDNVEIRDILPEDIEFLDVASYSSNLPATPNPLTVSEQNGITTLTWNWNQLPAASPGQVNSGYFQIIINVRVRPGTPAGPLENCVEWSPEDSASPVTVNIEGVDYKVTDFNSNGFPLKNCATLTVRRIAIVDSEKAIKGECDEEFKVRNPDVPGTGIGSTFAAGGFTYRLEIVNNGNVAINDMILADVLPYPNDNGVLAGGPRGTEWLPFFAGNIMPYKISGTTTSPAQVKKVSYSFETNPCPDFFFDANGQPLTEPGCTGPVFYEDPLPAQGQPLLADLIDQIRVQIRTIRVDFDEALNPRDTFRIFIEMQAPFGVTEADGLAFNNFAYQGIPENGVFLDAVEPIKVGIQVKENPAGKAQLGDFVWLDEDGDNVQDLSENGINGVRVRLFKKVGAKDSEPGDKDPSNDPADRDRLVGTRFTMLNDENEPGYYLFSDLDPNDEFGNPIEYYVVFDNFPPDVMPVTPNVGSNDGDDSDGQVMTINGEEIAMTGIYTLAPGEKNLTVDQGVNPMPDCQFIGPEITVVCIDNKRFQLYASFGTGNTAATGERFFVLTRKEGNPVDIIDSDIDLEFNNLQNKEPYLLNTYDIFDEDGKLNVLNLSFQSEANPNLCFVDDVRVVPPATVMLENINLTSCSDNAGANEYGLNVDLTIGEGKIPLNSEVLVTFSESGTNHSQRIDPVAGTTTLSFDNLTCDGDDNIRISATFVEAGTNTPISEACSFISAPFQEPCYVEIEQVIVDGSTCRTDGTYSIEVLGTVYNPGDDIKVEIDGQTIIVPVGPNKPLLDGATNQRIVKIDNITCDGLVHTLKVTASRNSNLGPCMSETTFEGPRDRDYGDLPQGTFDLLNFDFNTTNSSMGAYHLIEKDIYLGDCVDSEIDGAPDRTSGSSNSGGDDNTGANNPGESFSKECAGGQTDDEDGIRILTPMVPGEEACIEVKAVVPGTGGMLNAWIDFDGDGTFEGDANEQIVFNKRNNIPIASPSADAAIPSSGTHIFCFTVPDVADIFPNLETHLRFRLSSKGGLDFKGKALDGEIEDYFLQLAKIGDFVWNDVNKNGLQDPFEEGIPNVEVVLTRPSDGFTVTTTTDANGEYAFCGLLGDTYELMFTPDADDDFNPTIANPDVGSTDTNLDSDANPSNGKTQPISLLPGENNPKIDAGFWRYDFGDLPGPYATLELPDNGPRHAIRVNRPIFIGSKVDTEIEGVPSPSAGEDNSSGDDGNGEDDEDGVERPGMIFQGNQASFKVTATNKTDKDGIVAAFVDWNGDGLFNGNEAQTQLVPKGTDNGTFTFTYTVPADANTSKALGARFRIGTNLLEVNKPNGLASDGEVEDYLVKVKGLDYGDLPDEKTGNDLFEYRTRFDDNGPRHGLPQTPEIFFGDEVDDDDGSLQDAKAVADDENQSPDDEDGITKPGIIRQGTTSVFKAKVNAPDGVEVFVYGYIDWNRNGDFEESNGEVASNSIVGDGTPKEVMLTFTVPNNDGLPSGAPKRVVTNEDLGARFRVGSIEDEVGSPIGFAMDGEVEDCVVRVDVLDYGDLPDSYMTLLESNGPRHIINPDQPLLLGKEVDLDQDGQPDSQAKGDDNNGIDDEDGVQIPRMIFAGEKAILLVDVVNATGLPAYVYGFIDWDNSGTLGDIESEISFLQLAPGNHEDVMLMFKTPDETIIPLNQPLAARFRIGTVQDQVSTPKGFAENGEVEDYFVNVKGVDFGDLPDIQDGVSGGDYSTMKDNNGPRHGVPSSPTIFMGGEPDTEPDGLEDLLAGIDGTTGDDADGVDDENGVKFPMFFRGEKAEVEVAFTTDQDAYLYGFIDFNYNGEFESNEIAGIKIVSGTTSSPAKLTFQVPDDAVISSLLGARFRIGSIEQEVNTPGGLAMDGEVEDYVIRVKGLDYGDLPDEGKGTGMNNYETLDANEGARHAIPQDPIVYLGETVDVDDDGQPVIGAGEVAGGDDGDALDGDDEDGVKKPIMFSRGETATFKVQVVNKGAPAKVWLFGYVDWNKDGDFKDAEEKQSLEVTQTDEYMLTFNVPNNAVIGEFLGARFRVGSVQDEVDQATGFAMDGEVEDYVIMVEGLDYGDLPDPVVGTGSGNYRTLDRDNGARHAVASSPKLYIGQKVDVEADGRPSADAGGSPGTGDDGLFEDDEDGVLIPSKFTRTEKAVFEVTTFNETGSPAFLYGYVDWNYNGILGDDPNEIAKADVIGSGTVFLEFMVPADAQLDDPLGARFRIGSDQNQVNTSVGFAKDGEIEDYIIMSEGLDLGDAGEGFPTVLLDDGARHSIPSNPEIFLGEKVDVEINGLPSDKANGDDQNGSDDEDGVSFEDANGQPSMLIACEETTLKITGQVPQDGVGYLQAWIDYNDDGDWLDDGEQIIENLALKNVDFPYFYTFKVPCSVEPSEKVFLRFRFSTEKDLGVTGFAKDGEVEDYIKDLKALEFGDLPETYPTLLDDNGARHVVTFRPPLVLGATIDIDDMGAPTTKADGDDEDEDGDDEDGIQFITPLIEGYEACIRITEVDNKTDQPASLYAFADWNGDGNLTLFKTVDIPKGTTRNEDLCFTVPEIDSEKTQGMIYFRFRLSTDDAAANADGLAMDGEVEDYKLNLGKVGNVVWFDRNYNGIQDNQEADYGLNDLTLNLKFKGIDNIEREYQTQTDENGEYYFCGLIEGDYTIDLMNPNRLIPTLSNVNEALEDDKDSDGIPVKDQELTKTMASFTLEDILNNPTDEEGIEDQDLINGFPTNDVAGYPDRQVNQTIDFGFIAADLGDLPDPTYRTAMKNDGPRHTQPNRLVPEIPELFLGDKVDIDLDGQGTAMADGDDLDADGDDEDGVKLIKPLIPGYESAVRVKSTIPTGTIGYLNAWMDFNGNGALDDGDHIIKNELLVTGTGVVTDIAFEVPEDAVFVEGNAFARFRLSTVGGLSPVGGAPDGEVEDYKFPLGKIGNYVWEDFNFDGLQDKKEPGINGVPVTLVWAGLDGQLDTKDDEAYETITSQVADKDGLYYFCGLINGTYKIRVNTPEDMTPTRPNVTNANNSDEQDSDGLINPNMDLSFIMTDQIVINDITKLVENEKGVHDQGVVNNFPDNQVDETYDFGFAGLDYGDLPEQAQGEDFKTTMSSKGAVHVLRPDLRLGACVDAERDGSPDNDAGQFDGQDGDNDLGDDGTASTFHKPEANDCGDDEDGIQFITPLVPGYTSCISVSYTAPATGAVLQGWADWNGNGQFDGVAESLDLTNAGLLVGGTHVRELCFMVPEDAQFNDGMAFFRFRLSPTGVDGPNGPDKYDTATELPGGEVEDYRVKLGKVGNLVWEDRNNNGLQDEEEIELGINGVAIQLIFGGIRPDGTLDEIGDAGIMDDRVYDTETATREYMDGSELAGLYYYCGLIEGNYEIVVMDPKDLTPTKPNNIKNANEEDRDSDGIVVEGELKVKTSFTFEDQMRLMNLAEGEEGIGDQDLDNLLDPNMVGTFADNQVDQRFDFGYVAIDFGDLPVADLGDEYQYETELPLGPKHIVTPDLFLGSCVDAELDGSPDEEAGYKGNGNDLGDDATDDDPESWKQPKDTDCTDDEDGIEFVTPLVPGYEACIELSFNAIDNFDGPDAFLNAWIDFNGNGQLDDEEHIDFTKVNGNDATLEPLTKALELENGFKLDGDPVTICFEVPEDAKFLDGAAFMRFRLSFDPRLGPDDMLPNGEIPFGEVEDYFLPLTKVGNLVWEDRNFDGYQDEAESDLGINDVPVALIFSGRDGVIETTDVTDPQGDDRVYETTTATIDDVAGLYYFCGLIENNTFDYDYKIVVQTPEDMTPTRPDRTNLDDVFDSDGEDGTAAEGNNTDGIIDDVLSGMVMTEFEIVDADGQLLGEAGIGDDHGTAPQLVLTFPDEHANQSFDFGFAGLDYGDLPDDPDNPDDFNTLMMSDGAVHVIQPGKYLGSCVDAEREAAPEDKAGLLEGGDDNTESAFRRPAECGDDENGVILTTPMVVGYEACFEVSVTWPAGETAYLVAWIDYNSNNRFEPEEKVAFNSDLGPNPIVEITGTGGVQTLDLCFLVPGYADFPEGRAHARFRLSGNPDLGPDGPAKYGNDFMPDGEVEDYLFPLSKIGNLVWEDNNLDGIQDGPLGDPSEPGFEGIEMILVYAGYGDDQFGNENDLQYVTKTNGGGLYYFCGLIPGKYQVYIEKFVECRDGYERERPAHWILTVPNNEVGDKGDQFDSDGAPAAMVMIPDPMDLIRNEMGIGDDPGNINQYPDSLDNLTIDFGLIQEPNIEAILNDVGYDYPTSFECGHINVIMDLCIKNTESVPLENLQAMLDLRSQFGPGFVQFVSAEVVVDEAKEVEEYPVVTRTYNGGEGHILDGTSGLLYPGQEVCIRITVEINPEAEGASDPLMAQASVSAKAVNFEGVPIPDWCNGGEQFMVMDRSNDGKYFQGGYDDRDEKTNLSDCWKDADLIAQNDVVYVPVDGNCQMTITADMLLEGLKDQCTDEFFPLGGFYRVRYNDEEFKGEITVDVSDYNVGEPLVFEVRQIADFCNPVWGYVVPEDKEGAFIPEVNGELMLTCTDVDSLKKYFEADITQDKDDCSFSGVSWDLLREAGVFNIDELQDGCFDICALDIAISDLFMERDDCEGSMMLRTMRIKDVKGNVSTVQIPIRFKPVDLILDEIMEDRELDLCAHPGASENDLLRITGAPYYINGFGDKVYIDKEILNDENKGGLCNVSVAYEDQVIPDNCVRKVIRTWTIWDWCKDEAPITKVQNIKWGQLSAPLVTCPPRHTDTVSTGPFDCTASFIVPAPLVDGCVNNEFEYTIKVYKEQIKRDPTGLPVKPREYETVLYPAQVKAQADGTYLVGGLDMGTYYIGYNVTDACGNVADEVRCKYVVKDLSAPVAVCDDELHVSVGGDGISHITVEDVDEGSWDNCELVDIKIRRGLDSCYDSYLNEVYQIASIDELHEIETVDKFGNPLFLYYRVEGGKDTLIMKEFVNDSTYKFFTYWKDELWFTCCDISKGPEDFVRIELKATDAHGNENVCWMDQLIENKQVAECWAPEGFDIACTDLNFDPADYAQVVAALGEAADLVTVDFNCAASLSDTIKWEPTDCSEGVLTRIFSVTTFTAKGAVVNTCEQVINIYNVNDYLIKFPGDAEDTCDGDGGDDLELTTYACDVFAVNRDTAIFEANDDACFKRYVTYRIINWCEYDGVSLEPTIIPRDVDCDGDFSESTWVRVEGAADRENRVWIDDDNAPKEEPVITFVRDADSYTSLACDDNKEYWITPGYWEYTQVVKVYDDEAPIISFDTLEFCAFGTTGAADCQAEVMIPVSVVDSCTELVDIREVLIDVNAQGKPVNAIDELYTATLEGDTLMIASIAGVGLPVGEHKFLVRTADQCGNVANREIPFSIVDCKSPAPICTSILSVDLMPIVENKQVVGGANTVWATDFIASGVIDCTPHPDADVIPGSDNNVRYYAIRQDEVIDSIGTETPTAEELAAYMADVDAGRDFEDFRDVLFDCADNGAAITVFVIGVDGAGNLDYCTVMVNVQPGVDPDPCTGEATPDTTGRLSVAGLITTMEDELVEGVEVMLSGQEFAEMRTGTEGVYSFDGLQGGYDYSVTPRMDVDPMNGVSTFDLVKITQHILGTQALDHPLLMIAADVNNSQSITTIDLIQLRKLILSLDDHFSNNTSWRFIDASYEFPDPSNPWAEPFPEIVNINDLEDMMLDVDFYAVKVGDVNMSAVANSLDIEERNVAGVFELKAEDQYIEAGQTYAVTLSSEQLNEVLGYQYTLTYDNNVLELQDIDYGLLGEQNIGLRYVEEGMITVSWNEVAGLETTTAESSANDLITLHFRAYQSGQLSELLGISSRYTMAEAYDLNGQLQDVVIRFSDGSVKGVSYELYQNMPNPFMTQTTIGFHLPQADKAQMILRDAKGKVLQIVRGDYAKGYNMIRFERDNLPTGVIYYSLQSGDYTATRRMIIIE